MAGKIKCRSISKARIIQIMIGTTYEFKSYNLCPICERSLSPATSRDWTRHMVTKHRYMMEINQAVHIWQLIKWDRQDFKNDLDLEKRVHEFKREVTVSWKGAIV